MSNFRVIVEIPKRSKLKYEVNKETGRLALDRVLHGSNLYPQNYGYMEGTLDLDNDPMDVIILSEEVLLPGIEVDVRVIGALRMIDGGERDTKLIGVIVADPRYLEYQEISDVPKGILGELEDFFRNYKNLENKRVETNGFMTKKEALDIIEEGKELFKRKK